MDSRPGYQQKQYFNFSPGGYFHRAGNFNFTDATHNTGANHNTAYHPGTQPRTSQYPGTNQQFPHPLPPNPFTRIPFPPFPFPGTNPNTPQHSGSNPGSQQFGRAPWQFPGPPLFRPWFVPFPPPENHQPFEERRSHTSGTHFQWTPTQANDGTQRSNENARQTFGNNFHTRQRQRNEFAHSSFFGQDDKMETSEREKQQKKVDIEAEEARMKEKESIAKTGLIKHLKTSNAKVRTLELLCQDFKTPVFGDFPGNEAERIIVKNFAHFLKEQINEIKHVEREEKGKNWFADNDPVMCAPFFVMANTIHELEIKKEKLEKEKKYVENLNLEVKTCAGELEEKKIEAIILKTEVEEYDTRMKAMKERQSTERKNNDTERVQHGREMEEINRQHAHNLHEVLRNLQEEIGKETKALNETKHQLNDITKENDNIRARIFETTAKIEECKNLLVIP